MKDETRQALLGVGMDLNQTLARFGGNEGLMFRLLKRFLDDASIVQLGEAVEAGNMEDAFRAVHTLKGVAGNLGLGALFDSCAPLVERTRQGDGTDTAALYQEVKRQYDLAAETIRSLGDAP